MDSKNRFIRLPAGVAASLILSGLATAAGQTPSLQSSAEPSGSNVVSDQSAPPDLLTDETDASPRRRPGRQSSDPPPQDLPPGTVLAPSPGEIDACERMDGLYALCAPAIPDRWRLAETLRLVKPRWWDPYNHNPLKGDQPLPGTEDLFFILSMVSDTVVEPRSFPLPVGVQTTERSDSPGLFGDPNSLALSQTFVLGAALVQGATTFKPPDFELRAALAFNINHAEVSERRILFVQPTKGVSRTDSFVGVQELFFDKHLRNVSSRYDFDSIRIGVQPFSSDFRGFLFQDNQLGVRLFGSRDNNRLQYNLAAFARLEKDTNSGLNDVFAPIRKDVILFANLYRQDFLIPGFTSQIIGALNINREGDDIEIDRNGFPVRPALFGDLRARDYDIAYLGYNGDGRLGRLNLTASAYLAAGEDRNNVFTGRKANILAGFAALEPSLDFDWFRLRGSLLIASGDADPYDDHETGYDAIFENPQFAGADTSYWIRQSLPLIGGARAVSLNGRNGILNSLRSSKEQGQSNFNNPGTILAGLGGDADVTPELRVSGSLNHLAFQNSSSLEALRMQGDIGPSIGWDLSAALTYRPGFIQNIVLRGSAAILKPSEDFRALFGRSDEGDLFYSVLLNTVLTY
ncbi:MAG: hypothetical protein KGS00_05810 [Alphaproteobacteria bacterium]|nr:hypothetical protein [Alphaproteobacteria bacterium]